jgi:uncharacterized protein (TIGR03083 family)
MSSMPPPTEPPNGDPAPEKMGLLDAGPAAVRDRVERSWNAFLTVAESADLAAPSRLPGWRGQEVCTHLGSWDQGGVSQLISSARDGTQSARAPRNVDDDNAATVTKYADAPREDVLEALRANRDELLGWLATDEAAALGRTTVVSPIGPLPLLTAMGASSYELAVHALDLLPTGAREPETALLRNGLGAVLDVTGHLAYKKGVHIAVTATSPDGGWTVSADAQGWSVEPATELTGTGVRAELADLVDATAGRVSVPLLLATRRMTAHDLPGFLRLATLVEDVPGLPGAAALRAASRTLSGVESAVRGLSGMLSKGLSRLNQPRD